MRQHLPPSFWLVLAGLCFAGALASWPRPHAASSPHNTVVAPTPSPPPNLPPQRAPDDEASVAAPLEAPPRPSDAPLLPDEAADAAASAGPPQAGRQVLRCVERGRTVYRDAGGVCAEGVGEPVTLFPTRGVEAPR